MRGGCCGLVTPVHAYYGCARLPAEKLGGRARFAAGEVRLGRAICLAALDHLKVAVTDMEEGGVKPSLHV